MWPPSWVVLWLGGLVVGWSADYSSVSQVQPYAGEETVLEF